MEDHTIGPIEPGPDDAEWDRRVEQDQPRPLGLGKSIEPFDQPWIRADDGLGRSLDGERLVSIERGGPSIGRGVDGE